MRYFISIAAFFCVFFMACNRNDENTYVAKDIIDTSEVFVKDIPIIREGPRKGDTTGEFKYIRKNVEQFNLDNLEQGFDSLNIRIWLGHSMSPKHHIISIQRKESKWIGQLTIAIEQQYGENGVKLNDQSKEYKNIIPKSGWAELIDKIFSYEILTLPDESDLINYNGCGGDGLPFYFEIVTKHKYRFYSYCGIENNLQTFPEAKNVDSIARLLESEFEFKFIN